MNDVVKTLSEVLGFLHPSVSNSPNFVTTDCEAMSLSRLDLMFTLGVDASVWKQSRSYITRTKAEIVSLAHLSEDNWGAASYRNEEYTICDITYKDGECRLYSKVLYVKDGNVFTTPLLLKMKGGEWIWSANLSISGG